MIDFLGIQNNTENPTFLLILYTVLFSFLLSSMIAFTYEKTSRDVSRPMHFIQALILLSIVTATVMQAIGYSVARGLGMLGALAVIRFRTTLRNPRNIVFMFSSLAAGIACGVYGFVIAFVGTTGFCISAFALRLTPFSRKNNMIGILSFQMEDNQDKLKEVHKIMKKHCYRFALKKYRVINNPQKENYVELEYKLKMKKEEEGIQLSRVLKQVSELKRIRLSIQDMFEEV